jgi:hypothetical protein
MKLMIVLNILSDEPATIVKVARAIWSAPTYDQRLIAFDDLSRSTLDVDVIEALKCGHTSHITGTLRCSICERD